MDAIKLETAAFLLMALSLPLISVGSAASGSLWIAGFAVLVIGTLIPPILRYVDTTQATA